MTPLLKCLHYRVKVLIRRGTVFHRFVNIYCVQTLYRELSSYQDIAITEFNSREGRVLNRSTHMYLRVDTNYREPDLVAQAGLPAQLLGRPRQEFKFKVSLG